MEETTEKSRSLEGLYIFLRIVGIISFIVGAYLLLTSTYSGTSSTSISSGWQTLADNIQYIEFGMIVSVSLVCLIVAFALRKDSKRLAIFFIILGLSLPLLAWLLTISIPQPQIIPVSH